MRYEISHGDETFHVEVQEVGPHTYDVSVDGGPAVRVDAFKTPQTVYSILVGTRQYEGSVNERTDGRLDVHVGTSAFDFTAIDERRKLLVGSVADVASGTQEIRAQMAGKVVVVLVAEGESVETEQALLVIEAMKMENEIRSPIDGVVTRVGVAEGDAIDTHALLLVVEPAAEAE